MIDVEYRLQIVAQCPVDSSHDVYDVLVQAERTIPVEQIIHAVNAIAQTPQMQEELTDALSEALDATVTTTGTHSGVATRCVATPS